MFIDTCGRGQIHASTYASDLLQPGGGSQDPVIIVEASHPVKLPLALGEPDLKIDEIKIHSNPFKKKKTLKSIGNWIGQSLIPSQGAEVEAVN